MRILLGALLLAVPVGCSAPMYDWGSYETSLWDMYGCSYSPEKDLETLSAEVQRTVARGRRVPPGKFAHLGYLHTLQGDSDAARECFLREKEAYPESAHFIDLMMGRLP